MQTAKYSGRICRQCVETRISSSKAATRSISIYTRRRQKRTISGQASAWTSPSGFVDPFPFYQTLPPVYTSIDIDWKGKRKAKEEVVAEEVNKTTERKEQGWKVHEVLVEEVGVDHHYGAPFDTKGKGRAREEEVVEETKSDRTNSSHNFPTILKQREVGSPNLFLSGTSSLSLNLLQQHCDVLKEKGASSQLCLVSWLTGLTRAPTNDVRKNGRKWHVNVYLRAQLEQKQGMRPKAGTMPTSIDLLCADLFKKEVQRDFCDDDLSLLRKLAFQALRKNGFRTFQAIENMLKDDKNFAVIEQLPGSLSFLLSMKECFFIRQAKRGEWEQVWQARDEIVAFLIRQKELGQLYDANDDWQMDIVLIKSLTSHCAQHYAAHNVETDPKTRVDLAKDKYYFKQITLLHEQVKNIYGEISDKWLVNLIISLARGVESKSDLHVLSLTEYFDRLALTTFAQNLFFQQCQKEDFPSTDLMQAILGLELNWEGHCRAYKGAVGKERMAQQAEKHHNNVKGILQLLSEHQKQSESKTETSPMMIRKQVMDTLQATAMATQVSIKLLLLQGDYQTAVQRLEDFLLSVRPDEDYFHLTGGRIMPTQRSQQGSTAKSMMKTRRHTRGSFTCIALHLDKIGTKDKAKGVSVLLQLLNNSIERGVWDPWPIKKDTTRKSLRLLKVKPHFVDPCADLSALCARLLGLCRPVIPVHPNSVAHDYTVMDTRLSLSFYKVLEGIASLHQSMERRLALLQQKGLLNLAENRTRSKNTLRDIFVNRGTSAAQCIWAIFINPLEKLLIISRLKFLFDQVFIPLGLPGKGWTSARSALMQVLPSDNSLLKIQAWSIFEEAVQKGKDKGKFSSDSTTYSSPKEDEGKNGRVEMKILRRRLHRLTVLKERKRVAREKKMNRAIRRGGRR